MFLKHFQWVRTKIATGRMSKMRRRTYAFPSFGGVFLAIDTNSHTRSLQQVFLTQKSFTGQWKAEWIIDINVEKQFRLIVN